SSRRSCAGGKWWRRRAWLGRSETVAACPPGEGGILLRVDLHRLDELAPLRDLAADTLAERGRGAAARIDAVAAEALDQLGCAHRAIAGSGELLDHRRGRAGGRHHADPQDALVARHAELGNGR